MTLVILALYIVFLMLAMMALAYACASMQNRNVPYACFYVPLTVVIELAAGWLLMSVGEKFIIYFNLMSDLGAL